jgi:hypothetical protein
VNLLFPRSRVIVASSIALFPLVPSVRHWCGWFYALQDAHAELEWAPKSPVDPCPVERAHHGWCAPGSQAEQQDCEEQAARDREGLGPEGDDAQLGAALRAVKGKDFVDPCQEQGPEVGARPVVGARLGVVG